MSAVANLDDAGFRGGPLWLRVSPEQLEVDYSIRWSTFDQLLENRRPFRGPRNLVHALKHFVSVDCVVPGLRLAASCLFRVSECQWCPLSIDSHRGS
jgi:hypothetical protein